MSDIQFDEQNDHVVLVRRPKESSRDRRHSISQLISLNTGLLLVDCDNPSHDFWKKRNVDRSVVADEVVTNGYDLLGIDGFEVTRIDAKNVDELTDLVFTMSNHFDVRLEFERRPMIPTDDMRSVTIRAVDDSELNQIISLENERTLVFEPRKVPQLSNRHEYERAMIEVLALAKRQRLSILRIELATATRRVEEMSAVERMYKMAQPFPIDLVNSDPKLLQFEIERAAFSTEGRYARKRARFVFSGKIDLPIAHDVSFFDNLKLEDKLKHDRSSTEDSHLSFAEQEASSLLSEEDRERFAKLAGTERKVLVDARIGQGLFRERVIASWNGCGTLTYSCSDLKLLEAAHIRPWDAESNDGDPISHRVDGDNGLLLLGTQHAAFDEGYISFDDDGFLLVSPSLTNTMWLVIERLRVPLNERQRAYMAWHRSNVFKGVEVRQSDVDREMSDDSEVDDVEELSTTQKRYKLFFQSLIDELREKHEFTDRRKVRACNYVTLPTTNSRLSKYASYSIAFKVGDIVGVGFTLHHRDIELNRKIYNMLLDQVDRIHEQLGFELDWINMATSRRTKTIAVGATRDGSIDMDFDTLGDIQRWMVEHVLKIDKVIPTFIENAISQIKED